MVRIFGASIGVTVVALVAAALIGGPKVALIVAILAVLEISLSFDNAVVNATILRRMSPWWQGIFLTVGILIAVFGMRLIFPIVIVALTAHIGPAEVFRLALNDPNQYAEKLTQAHPSIAAFGGIFLLMIFLDFMFDPEREIHWLGPIERTLGRLGKLDVLSVVVALTLLLVVAEGFSELENGTSATQQVLTAGVAGLAVYLGVRGLGEYFESQGVGEDDDDSDTDDLDPDGQESGSVQPSAASEQRGGVLNAKHATGKAAFFLFLYLELIDASFSFDGVVGAFAITQEIFVIAAGLGIGALYIRSLTVYLVRKGTLQEYIYLEHGAHWAIGALAVLLAITITHEVPEVVTGLIGVGFIALALGSSIVAKRRREAGEPEVEGRESVRV
ncbi:MAG: uncharacterized protein QOJ32_1912 [Frankiaceae bacterium]|nr:uncharacterized protein [Frankiaceae bacterium]